MSTQPSPATFTFATGHEFGEATFRAILGLPEYGMKVVRAIRPSMWRAFFIASGLVFCLPPRRMPRRLMEHGPFCRFAIQRRREPGDTRGVTTLP